MQFYAQQNPEESTREIRSSLLWEADGIFHTDIHQTISAKGLVTIGSSNQFGKKEKPLVTGQQIPLHLIN